MIAFRSLYLSVARSSRVPPLLFLTSSRLASAFRRRRLVIAWTPVVPTAKALPPDTFVALVHILPIPQPPFSPPILIPSCPSNLCISIAPHGRAPHDRRSTLTASMITESYAQGRTTRSCRMWTCWTRDQALGQASLRLIYPVSYTLLDSPLLAYIPFLLFFPTVTLHAWSTVAGSSFVQAHLHPLSLVLRVAIIPSPSTFHCAFLSLC